MKLAEIRIDRCGVWRDLTLPLNSSGLNVLYGPNEAGKSTLLRFVRGVLYGFSPACESAARDSFRSKPAAGSLVLESEAGPVRLRRAATGAERGAPTLTGNGSMTPAGEFLAEALQGIDEHVFQSLFAVDLGQLQELGVLTGDEAAERIYDVSLGPDGQRLLEAGRRADADRRRLVDSLQQDGELVRLFERQDQLSAQLLGLDRRRAEYDERCAERDRLEKDVAELKRRQSGISQQLRGHLFLERVWGPWQRLREWRSELAGLPEITAFPDSGLERMERLENDIAAAAESRDHALAAARQCRERCLALSINHPLYSQFGFARGFVEQQDWFRQLQDRREAVCKQITDAEANCTQLLALLGPEWTADRLAALDLSPAGWEKLSGTAQSLRAANLRRQSLERACRRLAAHCRELRESIAECLHDLGGRSVDEALGAARDHLRQMGHLARLQIREAELNQRQCSLLEHRERIVPQLTLPRWVHVLLGVFCFMGIVLGGWGMIAGVVTSGIAGAIYAMLGITCGGLAWGLKAQYEGDARRRIDDTDAQLAQALAELREVRQSIGRLAGSLGAANEGTSAAVEGGELVRRAAERVAELVDLSRHQRNLRSQRRRLEQCRQKRLIARREFETVRLTWRELLARLGLADSGTIGNALATWQQLVEARAAVDRLAEIQESSGTIDSLWKACRDRLAEFGHRLQIWDVDYDRPLDVLDKWAGELAELARVRQERRELRAEFLRHRRQAAANQERVNELKVERDALLVQAGAASRDEFDTRARQFARRRALENQCADQQDELDAICREHSDLALVEEDLLAYDARTNSDCIETLNLEAADLERDLRRACDELHNVEHEIRSLEEDRSEAVLRLELEEVRYRLRSAARQWAVVELAAQAGDELRRDFEQRHQPAVLVSASGFFARLTQGRYATVWSPLGERKLMIDDDHGRSLPVAALSRGTREQLFLAVRLAIIDELSHKGTVLPLLLDDVLVNFDERRAEAAADVLCEFARDRHQILFLTCHLHLARLFQGRGIEPIWLPDHHLEYDAREEQRRAG